MRLARSFLRASSSLILRLTPTRAGRHQHKIPAGNADICGQGRPFCADAFLDDLHKHFAAAVEISWIGGLLRALRSLTRRGRPRRWPDPPLSLSGVFGGRQLQVLEILLFDVADVQKSVASHFQFCCPG